MKIAIKQQLLISILLQVCNLQQNINLIEQYVILLKLPCTCCCKFATCNSWKQQLKLKTSLRNSIRYFSSKLPPFNDNLNFISTQWSRLRHSLICKCWRVIYSGFNGGIGYANFFIGIKCRWASLPASCWSMTAQAMIGNNSFDFRKVWCSNRYLLFTTGTQYANQGNCKSNKSFHPDNLSLSNVNEVITLPGTFF